MSVVSSAITAKTIADVEREGHRVIVVDRHGVTVHATRRRAEARPALQALRLLLYPDAVAA